MLYSIKIHNERKNSMESDSPISLLPIEILEIILLYALEKKKYVANTSNKKVFYRADLLISYTEVSKLWRDMLWKYLFEYTGIKSTAVLIKHIPCFFAVKYGDDNLFKWLRRVQKYPWESLSIMNVGIQKGNLELAKEFAQRSLLTKDQFVYAVKSKSMEMLKYMKYYFLSLFWRDIPAQTVFSAVHTSVKISFMEGLEWLHEWLKEDTIRVDHIGIFYGGCISNAMDYKMYYMFRNVAEALSKSKSPLIFLTWLHTKMIEYKNTVLYDSTWEHVAYVAVSCNSIIILTEIIENKHRYAYNERQIVHIYDDPFLSIGETLTHDACQSGNLEILQYLLSKSYSINVPRCVRTLDRLLDYRNSMIISEETKIKLQKTLEFVLTLS